MAKNKSSKEFVGNVDLNETLHKDVGTAKLTGNKTRGTARKSGRNPGDKLIAAGNDVTLQGGVGKDTLVAEGNRSVLRAGTGANVLVGSTKKGAKETLVGNGKSELEGGKADTTFVIDGTGDKISSDAGGLDTIRAPLNSFNLSAKAVAGGNAIENFVYTGTRSATLIGNNLDNLIFGGRGNDSLSGLGGNDTLSGENGTDTLLGGDGEDSLLSGQGSDELYGGTGNDFLDGGIGEDSHYGGAGNDTYVVESPSDVIVERTGEGSDWVDSSVSHALFRNVENLELTGNAATRGTGNSVSNRILGNAAANTLLGLDGNDTLLGNGGHDYLDGGAGVDSLEGGDGHDTLVGGMGDLLLGGGGNDVFLIDDSTVKVAGGAGTNTVFSPVGYTLSADAQIQNLVLTGLSNTSGTGNSDPNKIEGNSGQNTLVGNAGLDTLIAREGADSLSGGGGKDFLSGGEGNDSLNGGTDMDTMEGGDGNDYFIVDSASDFLSDTGGIDTVETSTSFDISEAEVGQLTVIENLIHMGVSPATLTGSDANNSIRGGAADETVVGGLGNDTLDGRDGKNSLVGEAGDDFYILSSVNDVVVEASNAGTDTVRTSFSNLALAANIENLVYTGNAPGSFTGNARPNSIAGGAANDSLFGGSDNDTLVGGTGNNMLSGGSGVNSLVGGTGNDLYLVDSSSDAINDAGGLDSVRSSVSFTLAEGLEVIQSTRVAVVRLTGNAQYNSLVSGRSGDTLIGGRGNDTYIIGQTGVVLSENPEEGIDVVFASVNHTLASGLENLFLTGTANLNATGNSLANRIEGNAGANRIDGRAEVDSLFGGAGNDTFVHDAADAVVDGGTGIDVVESEMTVNLADGRFRGVENIALTGSANIDATGDSLANLIEGNEGANLIDGGAGVDELFGGNGNDTLVYDPSDSVIDGQAGRNFLQSANSLDLRAGNVRNIFGGYLTGDSNSTLGGNTAGNSLVGNSGLNLVSGFEGDDTLNGGNDTLADTLAGGGGNDLYLIESPENVIDDIAGNDTVRSAVSFDIGSSAVIGVENLVLTGSAMLTGAGNNSADLIVGNTGDNSLDGRGGRDTLDGGAGNDTLNGGNGDGEPDLLRGGQGNDLYILDSGLDRIVDVEGRDAVLATFSVDLASTLVSGIENIVLNPNLPVADANINAAGNQFGNEITGNSGNNQLDGRGGIDTLSAGSGNDILQGGANDGEADFLFGGDGNDVYIVDSTPDVIRDSAGRDTVQSGVSFNLASGNVSGVENLVYTGSAKATLQGTAADNAIVSQGEGDDTLDGGAGSDTLDGGAGANSLVGGEGDDFYVIHSPLDGIVEGSTSLGGLDTALVKIPAFALAAKSNLEILTSIFNGNSSLVGSNSDNTINGGAFSNTLRGEGGRDYLLGSGLADSLVGGTDDDTLDGRGGNDTLAGGAGNDFYFTASQSIRIVEEAGEGSRDMVASSVDFSLVHTAALAQIEDLLLLGNGNTRGTGNSVDNILTGSDGNNTLSSGEGNDTLLGGLGADIVFGELGDDSIVGGGNPQTDIPNNASTPIVLASGQTYSGTGDFRSDTDWIKVNLVAGVTYTFDIDSQLTGAAPLTRNSDVAFGKAGDAFGGVGPDKRTTVINTDGTIGYGDFKNFRRNSKSNVIGFDFTPFDSGVFYIPVSGAGPATGTYRVTLTDLDNPESGQPAFADNAGNTLVGGAGMDTLISGNGLNTLGVPFGDILLGGSNTRPGVADTDQSEDLLIGGDGNDTFDGGGNADSMIGGKGDDLYYIDDPSDEAIEKIGEGVDRIIANLRQSGGLYDIDLKEVFANIEHASMIGTANLSAIGNLDANSLSGNSGNNTLDGREGDDTLLGGGGNDSLFGFEGADSLYGGSGINTLDGGKGSDTYLVDRGSDCIVGEPEVLDGGIDLVRTRVNFDPIQAVEFSRYFNPFLPDGSPAKNKSQSFASGDLETFYNLENFELLDGANYAIGNARNNEFKLSGALGGYVLGQGGDDTIGGGNGNDSLFGDDNVFYATPDLYAAASTDTRTREFVDGVMGSTGNDVLLGGAGNDWLDGGGNYDTMVGGDGNDTFVMNHVRDFVDASGGGSDELFSSVNLPTVVDGISRVNLVVVEQKNSGQTERASFASFAESNPSYTSSTGFILPGNLWSFSRNNIAKMEVHYGMAEGLAFEETPSNPDLKLNVVAVPDADPANAFHRLSWDAKKPFGDPRDTVLGYVVEYRLKGNGNPWLTYVRGSSQDFQGTADAPELKVRGLDTTGKSGKYEFRVTAQEFYLPTAKKPDGSTFHQVVTLEGGHGPDVLSAGRLPKNIPGNLVTIWDGKSNDDYLNSFILNNPIDPLHPDFIETPAPHRPDSRQGYQFAGWLDGGEGDDVLLSGLVGNGSGADYMMRGVQFRGLNTLVGGKGSDTFLVVNGGTTMGAEFDHVIKYGNETPPNFEGDGQGASLNGGRHNLVVTTVPFTTLSDTVVSQGKFIDRLTTAEYNIFARGNRLDNYMEIRGGGSTLVGAMGRDSIVATTDIGKEFMNFSVLVGGTAHGLDNIGLALRATNGSGFRSNASFRLKTAVASGADSLTLQSIPAGLFVGQVVRGVGIAPDTTVSAIDSGLGLITLSRKTLAQIPAGELLSTDNQATYLRYRDTDPVPPGVAGAGAADTSQYWLVETPEGLAFDQFRNSDTLRAHPDAFAQTLDGGAGSDYLVGSSASDRFDRGDTFYVSNGRPLYFYGEALIHAESFSHDIRFGDAVIGNGGNDTIVYTDSDNYWSGKPGATTAIHGYSISRDPSKSDITNLILGKGAPTARVALGNSDSTGVVERGTGSNWLVGNEFDNTLDGGGVGGRLGRGQGIDTLTGGAGSDFFVVRGYTSSSNNEWEISTESPEEGLNAGKFVLSTKDSTYTDADYVLITDFSETDKLGLSGLPWDFWIGAAPGKSGLESNNVKPGPVDSKNFGIYRASEAGGNGPNLVAHVQTTGLSVPGGFALSQADLSPANHAFTPNLGTVSSTEAYLGWGEFYRLDGSSIAARISIV